MTNRFDYISSKLSSLFKFIDCISLKSVDTTTSNSIKNKIHTINCNENMIKSEMDGSHNKINENNINTSLNNRSKSEVVLNKNNFLLIPKIKIRAGSLRKKRSNNNTLSINGTLKTPRLDETSNDARIATGYNPLTRNGTIRKNQFRGIKTELLQKQTNLLILSMTVCIIILLFFFSLNKYFMFIVLATIQIYDL